MKNIVFMMDIDLEGKGDHDNRYHSKRRLPYQYSIASWRQWCEKHNCELFVLNELLYPNTEMPICFQRHYIFDLMEANNIEYDQILSVDADTIVHPDCPNFFEMTNGEYTVVQIDGSWDWIMRSIENYSNHVFNGFKMPWDKYFDSGFWIVNKKHKDFEKSMTDFYWENKEKLQQIEQTFHNGTEQTPLNFMLHTNNIDITLLPYEYNMNDMHRKGVLDEDLTMTKTGWIYQYNAIPNNKNYEAATYWMQKTYEHLYGKLND